MRNLFNCANQYIKESTWKDLALIKICLCAMGILIGLMVPKQSKKTAATIAVTAFIVTYIPTMAKFLRISATKNK